MWRRKRDSNPRASSPANGFQDRRLQPLGHSSVTKVADSHGFLNTVTTHEARFFTSVTTLSLSLSFALKVAVENDTQAGLLELHGLEPQEA